MEPLDFRRGLILVVIALRSKELFEEVIDVGDLRELPPEVRHRIISVLGDVDAGYGFGASRTGFAAKLFSLLRRRCYRLYQSGFGRRTGMIVLGPAGRQ